MDWLSKAEKEEVVIQLYKENKSFREIATLMHMSFRDIGAITKKVELQAARERGYVANDIEPKSKESQAFKLFLEGRSPVEVAIALDEPGDRVRAGFIMQLKYIMRMEECIRCGEVGSCVNRGYWMCIPCYDQQKWYALIMPNDDSLRCKPLRNMKKSTGRKVGIL
jgi:hypothetical protein